MSDRPEDPPGTPAEQRLEQLLGQIQTHPPVPSEHLVGRVVDAARWERGVRHAGQSVGGFGAGLLEGLAIILGIRKAR
jgi:hypothetical protein